MACRREFIDLQRGNKLSHLQKINSTLCPKAKSPMSFEFEWDLDFPITRETSVSNPKTTIQIVNEGQNILPRKIRTTKSVVLKSAIKGSGGSQVTVETSRKVSVRPFSSTEDLNVKAVEMKDKEDSDAGFMIIKVKKQALKSGKHPSQQRLKWSSERERVPCLDSLCQGNSQAQVGGALNYTDTSHWCSNSAQSTPDVPVSAIMDEEDGQFTWCGSIGKLVGQQLQHCNVVRVGTNGHYKRTGESPEGGMPSQAQSPTVKGLAEPVSLSITDELERKNAKILTPRSPSVYLSLPIVSETYPVVCHAELHQQKPFSSPGFHSLEPREGVYQSSEQTSAKKSMIHAAIIHITQSMQEKHLVKRVKERQWVERYHAHTDPETAVKAKKWRARKVNLRALSANGDIVKSKDLDKLSIRCHSESPSTAAPGHKGSLVPIITIQQKSLSTANVGHVLNGVNPKHCPDISMRSSDYLRGLLGKTRGKTMNYRHQTPSLSQRNISTKPENKMDFLLISKPLKYNRKDINPFVCKQLSKKECCPGQTLLPETQVANSEGMGVSRVSTLSRSNSSSGCKFHKETSAGRGTPVDTLFCVPLGGPKIPTEDSDYFAAGKVFMAEVEDKPLHFNPQQAISIPTAASM